MKCLDLFSGIGGIALGLEAAGMETVGFCERESACRYWLSQHWPHTPIYDDIKTLTGAIVKMDCGPIDIIAGGFPCQPFSVAGKQKGTEDERHLWPEMSRIIREVRPRWVLAENVPGLRTIAADLVLEDLEGQGYTCWPLVVGASDVGAPHRRQRVWIIGLRKDSGPERRDRGASVDRGLGHTRGSRLALGSFAEDQRRDVRQEGPSAPEDGPRIAWPSRPGEPQHPWEAPRLAHTERQRRSGRSVEATTGNGAEPKEQAGRDGMADSPSEPPRSPRQPRQDPDPRESESPMGGAVDGLPDRLAGLSSSHRREALKALGNSVVPPLVTVIGRAIMKLDREFR